MKVSLFKRMCNELITISKTVDPERSTRLKVFMCQGYLFLSLTDNQVEALKKLLAEYYPNEYKVYDEPDEYGNTSAFYYLRFK